MEATLNRGILVIIPDMETEPCRIDIAVTPEQQGAEDRLGEEIQDAVKDGLGVRRDDVAALADAPCDRVQEPQEDGEAAADEVDTVDVGSEGGCVLACSYGEGPSDDRERRAAEDEVGPLRGRWSVSVLFRGNRKVLGARYLVIGHHESTDQSGDDHDLVDEEGEENRRPWQ